MAPAGRNLRQRAHDEEPFVGPGVRQDQARPIHHRAAVGDEVEIEGARCVGLAPPAAERSLDRQQGRKGRLGARGRRDQGDAVSEVRGRRIGPGLRAPPARARQDPEARWGESRQGGLQKGFARIEVAGQVAAQADDDDLVQADAALC
jgi:hypothetical protein